MKKFALIFVFASLFAEECPFCNEEIIHRQFFCQGEETLALVTHKPAMPGHVLVIPKRHVERFEDLSASEVGEMFQVIQKVHHAVSHLYGTTGYLLVQKNGREAGQSVPHVHFHYLPCKVGDSQAYMAFKFLLSPWARALTPSEMAPEIAALAHVISGDEAPKN